MQDIQTRYEKIFKKVKSVGQEQVLQFWPQLRDDGRQRLLDQLDTLDFDRIEQLVNNCVIKPAPFKLPATLEPAPCYPAEAIEHQQSQLYRRAWQTGEQALADGKVCAFTVAGGMGTRLGFNGPKGCFRISPVKNKTLFELFAEYIGHCKRRYNPQIRWFIMTSRDNHQVTVEFFQQNEFFGLPADHVMFFEQALMPAFGADGKLLLDRKDSLALSPDGHGGSLRALRKSGALDQMSMLGIEHVSYFQIDNPLVRPLDPHFIGLHIIAESEMSSKSIPKAHDKEKVGVFAKGDGKLMVVEYSDLPDELAVARNADGTRTFDAGSIAIHLISRRFVERITEGDLQLPYHRAVKKVAFVDDDGERIEPIEPNGIKLEQFVFDAIALAENPIVVETIRAEEFSPVKNASGADSEQTCRRDLNARAVRWLERAGIFVSDDPNCPVEISPTRAIFADDLKFNT